METKFISIFDESYRRNFLINIGQIVHVCLESNEVVMSDRRVFHLSRGSVERLKKHLYMATEMPRLKDLDLDSYEDKA